jgi:hypothetical protein
MMPTLKIDVAVAPTQRSVASSSVPLRDCPRWQKCNAPLCPLESIGRRRVLKNDEPVCFFLIEAQKANSEAVFGERGLGWLHCLMLAATPALTSRYRRIETALERAKGSGSRMQTQPPTGIRHG